MSKKVHLKRVFEMYIINLSKAIDTLVKLILSISPIIFLYNVVTINIFYCYLDLKSLNNHVHHLIGTMLF